MRMGWKLTEGEYEEDNSGLLGARPGRSSVAGRSRLAVHQMGYDAGTSGQEVTNAGEEGSARRPRSGRPPDDRKGHAELARGRLDLRRLQVPRHLPIRCPPAPIGRRSRDPRRRPSDGRSERALGSLWQARPRDWRYHPCPDLEDSERTDRVLGAAAAIQG